LIDSRRKEYAKYLIDRAPEDHVCLIKQKSRTLEQNAKMWAMLVDLERQVIWYGMKLHAEEWKDILTASLKGQKTVPGLNGGFVVTGSRTSKMGIKEMSDVIELAYAFGAEHDVKWSEHAD
jgi:hypothetical protein